MDDMLIISTNINVVNDTKKYLTLKFKMKNLNEVDTILGIKIRKHSGSFVLCQSHYIDKVLNKFNHLNIKVANTSNVVSCKLIENTGRSIAQIEYASVIGSLIYVMHCNISHFRDKTTISCQSKNRVINFFLYIYIHGLRIKIYRNFDEVPLYTGRSQVIDMEFVYTSNSSHLIT